jgi:NitT/TauT family transport system substrate-binding protein
MLNGVIGEKHRSWTTALVVAGLIGVSFFIWERYGRESQVSSQDHELRFSYNSFAGSLPGLLAQELGYYQNGPCAITLVREDDHLTASADFSVGEIDGTATTLGTAVARSGQAVPFSVVFVKDESLGADALLAGRAVNDVRQLRGKKIGVVSGDFSEVWLEHILRQVGIDLQDITMLPVPGSEVVAKIQSGDIDAGHTWSPYKEVGEKQGMGVLVSTANDPFMIVDVVLFKKKAIAGKRECVRYFLSGWSRAVDYWRSHDQEAAQLLAKPLGGEPSGITLAGLRLYNATDQLELWNNGSLARLVDVYAASLAKRGGLIPHNSVESLLDGSLVSELGKVESR